MSESVKVTLDGADYELPIIVGSQDEKAIDIRKLRAQSGYISYDDGYGNTGSCQSDITFIDGENGVLRYRGYPIEELAQKSDFIECAYLVIYGELPTAAQRDAFSQRIREQAPVHIGMRHFFETFPMGSSPMAILSAMLNSLGCYYPEMSSNNRAQDLEHFDNTATILISKIRTLTAMTYRQQKGLPFVYPKRDLVYCQNFLHMMFSEPYRDYVAAPEVSRALNLMLLLHADHEQNCSTSTVRMVASSGANLFASVSAGVSALWGPLHGGANAAVIKMLEEIHNTPDLTIEQYVDEVKAGKQKLMGFGHRVYKNYDPRAKIFRKVTKEVLNVLKIDDPLLELAEKLEEIALKDDYFVSRKLYPNVDFYSGILLRAIGIPTEMFTVMFAIGRMPGWIANWKEIAQNPKSRIYRPRQVYTGPTQREYVPIDQR